MQTLTDASEHQRHVTAKNALLTAVRTETVDSASYWFNMAWSNGIALPLLTEAMRQWSHNRANQTEESSE